MVGIPFLREQIWPVSQRTDGQRHLRLPTQIRHPALRVTSPLAFLLSSGLSAYSFAIHQASRSISSGLLAPASRSWPPPLPLPPSCVSTPDTISPGALSPLSPLRTPLLPVSWVPHLACRNCSWYFLPGHPGLQNTCGPGSPARPGPGCAQHTAQQIL